MTGEGRSIRCSCVDMKIMLKLCIWSVVLLVSAANIADARGYLGKKIGDLGQLQHAVKGAVYAVDSRTIHIKGFSYDGTAPDAFFYAGTSGTPSENGVIIPDENGRREPLSRYNNKDVTLTLPDALTLKDIVWISIWCRAFTIDFGHIMLDRNFDYPRPQKIDGLPTLEHGVRSDKIVVVDAQTFLIPDFYYDGTAPDAHFWVGKGTKPGPNGKQVPDENGGTDPLKKYSGKTIVITLPGEMTVFDIDYLSIWCRAFFADFGHVRIPRNLNIPPSLKMLGVAPQKNGYSYSNPPPSNQLYRSPVKSSHHSKPAPYSNTAQTFAKPSKSSHYKPPNSGRSFSSQRQPTKSFQNQQHSSTKIKTSSPFLSSQQRKTFARPQSSFSSSSRNKNNFDDSSESQHEHQSFRKSRKNLYESDSFEDDQNSDHSSVERTEPSWPPRKHYTPPPPKISSQPKPNIQNNFRSQPSRQNIQTNYNQPSKSPFKPPIHQKSHNQPSKSPFKPPIHQKSHNQPSKSPFKPPIHQKSHNQPSKSLFKPPIHQKSHNQPSKSPFTPPKPIHQNPQKQPSIYNKPHIKIEHKEPIHKPIIKNPFSPTSSHDDDSEERTAYKSPQPSFSLPPLPSKLSQNNRHKSDSHQKSFFSSPVSHFTAPKNRPTVQKIYPASTHQKPRTFAIKATPEKIISIPHESFIPFSNKPIPQLSAKPLPLTFSSRQQPLRPSSLINHFQITEHRQQQSIDRPNRFRQNLQVQKTSRRFSEDSKVKAIPIKESSYDNNSDKETSIRPINDHEPVTTKRLGSPKLDQQRRPQFPPVPLSPFSRLQKSSAESRQLKKTVSHNWDSHTNGGSDTHHQSESLRSHFGERQRKPITSQSHFETKPLLKAATFGSNKKPQPLNIDSRLKNKAGLSHFGFNQNHSSRKTNQNNQQVTRKSHRDHDENSRQLKSFKSLIKLESPFEPLKNRKTSNINTNRGKSLNANISAKSKGFISSFAKHNPIHKNEIKIDHLKNIKGLEALEDTFPNHKTYYKENANPEKSFSKVSINNGGHKISYAIFG